MREWKGGRRKDCRGRKEYWKESEDVCKERNEGEGKKEREEGKASRIQ